MKYGAVYSATIESRIFQVILRSSDELDVNDEKCQYDFVAIDPNHYSLIINGQTHFISILRQPSQKGDNAPSADVSIGKTITLEIDGVELTVLIDDEGSRFLRSLVPSEHAGAKTHTVRAPMPGLIRQVEVKVGDAVNQGTGMVILEAMKMENEIRAPKPGVVQLVHAVVGSAVEKGEALVTIQMS